MQLSKEKVEQAISLGLRWGLVSIAIIVIVLVSWEELPLLTKKAGGVLGNANWLFLVLGWLLMCSALVALGYRWRALLSEKPAASFLSVSLCAALLLNYAIPGPFGEVAAAWFVHKRYAIPMADSLASGTSARLIGLATAAFASVVLWLVSPFVLSEPLKELVFVATFLVFLGLLLLFFLFVFPTKWHAVWERANERKGGLLGKIGGGLLALAKAFARVGRPKRILQAFFWSCLGHVLAYMGVAVSLWSLIGTEAWSGIAFTYCLGTSIGAVAFLFPGSQLGWDASFATLLVASSEIDVSSAAASTLVLRIEQLLMMMLGAFALLWLRAQLLKDDSL